MTEDFHLFSRSYTNQHASKDKQGEGFFNLELHSLTTFDSVCYKHRMCGLHVGHTCSTHQFPIHTEHWSTFAKWMKLGHLPVTVIVVTEEWRLVDGALEDEPRPAGGAEGRGAEGADGSEGVRPVGKRGLSPILGCPLWADVAARHKTVSGGSSVYVHSRLTAQPQGHVGTHAPAQGTFSACCGTIALSWILLSLGSLAPVVASMDMAASEVDPGLTLFKAEVTHHYQYLQIC